jgi:hypothetical protein
VVSQLCCCVLPWQYPECFAIARIPRQEFVAASRCA